LLWWGERSEEEWKEKEKGRRESRAVVAMVAVAIDGRAPASVVFLSGAQPLAGERGTGMGRKRARVSARSGSF
jgi:hypothetical protein